MIITKRWPKIYASDKFIVLVKTPTKRRRKNNIMTCVIKRADNFLTDSIHLLLGTAHALDVGQQLTQAPYHSFQFWSLCIWNVNFGRRRHISMMFCCICRGRHNVFYEWTNILFAFYVENEMETTLKAVDLIVLKWFHPFQCPFFFSFQQFMFLLNFSCKTLENFIFFRLVYCCVDALIAAICSQLKSSNVPPAAGE